MDRNPPWTVVISCEHAGNRVPRQFASLFQGQQELLDSHRGWDPGALALARVISNRLGVPLLSTSVSRLLVEPNRSLHHRQLFSEFTRHSAPDLRELLLAKYYFPHRNRVEHAIRGGLAQGHRVFHCSVHTFTSALNGKLRRADIGLLYDPTRRMERTYCDRWQHALQQDGLQDLGIDSPRLRIRKNYPYRGQSDGLTTYLRKLFPGNRYVGMELEVNQKWSTTPAWRPLGRLVAETLERVLTP